MSFLSYDSDCQFPLENLPYGVFSTGNSPKRIGVAIADKVLDLAALVKTDLIDSQTVFSKDEAIRIFSSSTLNDFISCKKSTWQAWRKFLQSILVKGSPLEKHPEREALLIHLSTVQLHLPIQIGDYTDFYSSYQHAYNCGVIIRGKENPMQPNWSWLPVGYHGRASSIVISGTPIRRPRGQRTANRTDTTPTFGPSVFLDYELEMGFIIGGQGNSLGESISADEADEHIFGCVIVNDWSARDIQAWEYVPLGPFLSKSFATTISPWIVTMDALEPFKIPAPEQNPPTLPYLTQSSRQLYDVELEVELKPKNSQTFTRLATSNLKNVYWSFGQQLAHHTINGCPMRPGDLCATGTISGETPDNYGSLLEKTQGGRVEFKLDNGDSRIFIQDGDEIKLTAIGTKGDIKIGFGECVGKILPAVE